jgi:hypothetical protein
MKSNLFEYIKLDPDKFKARDGREFDIIKVVSKNPEEIKAVKDDIKNLEFKGFKPNKNNWDGFYWFMFKNKFAANKDEIVQGIKDINDKLAAQGNQSEDIDDFVAQLDELAAAVESSDIETMSKEALADRINQFVEDIANATDERAAEGLIQDYLNFSMKFHKYSFGNTMLIYLQDPKATKVMGAKAWKVKMKATVDLDNAIPIWIWCKNEWYRDKNDKPKPYYLDQKKSDRALVQKEKSGQPLTDKEKQQLQAAKNRLDTMFKGGWKGCKVYDIRFTDLKDSPEMPKWEAADDDDATAMGLFSIAKKSLEASGVKVTQDPAHAGEGGWSRKGQINVTQGKSGTGAASVIFHEWAHDLLHQEGGKFKSKALAQYEQRGDIGYREIKQIKEVQAETVSAVLCKWYGLPTDNHPTYIALWQAQGKLQAREIIKENITTIANVCNHIISEIENYKGEFEVYAKLVAQQNQGGEED